MFVFKIILIKFRFFRVVFKVRGGLVFFVCLGLFVFIY